MPVTAAQYKTLIPVKVGDTGVVAANIDVLWAMHDDKTPLELQYNYALIEAIELLLGGKWSDVTWSGDGRAVHSSHKFNNLIAMAARADKRICTLEAQRLQATGVVVSNLTTRAPISVPENWIPNPNSLDYGGAPNVHRQFTEQDAVG